jgi:hypothetical protein
MGRKIATVSDNMHDVQGKADMQGFFNDISKMKGFSGMTADQEQQLATAVQNGTVSSQADMDKWLANNHIISANVQTTQDNTQQYALAWNTLKDGINNTGPALAGNLAQLAGYIKSTAGSSNNISQETSTIAFEFKGGLLKTQSDLATFSSNWTTISTATKGSSAASQFYTNLLNSGAITLQTPVASVIQYWQEMSANGLKATSASYKYMQLLQAAANQPAPPPIAGSGTSSFGTHSLPHGQTKIASGGIISEEIFGVGLKSGGTYAIGEAGPEAVVPLGIGGSAAPLPVGHSGGGGGGDVTIVQVSFPNSLTFLNSANQVDELARAIESRLATVRLPHRGVRLSPH